MRAEPTSRLLGRARRARSGLLAIFALYLLLILAEAAPASVLTIFLAVAILAILLGIGDGAIDEGDASDRSEPRPTDFTALACSIVSILPDPALLMDRRGMILFQNDNADNVLGHRELGHHISSVLRAPQVLDAVTRVQETHEIARVEFSQPVPIERTFEIIVAPVMDRQAATDGSATPALIMVLRDLTHKGRIERMRADFVAFASHELRTPLSSLMGFVETLQGPARNDPAARDRFLTMMRVEAVRMSRLIDDLLSLSRIELNVHLLPAEEIDIASVVDHAVDILTPLAGEQNVTIRRPDPGTVRALTVNGDHDELVQVFRNLIENAIKYGQDGKYVDLEIRPSAIDLRGEPAAGVVITIRDFGPGIAAEHLPRLTERFYRVDVSHSREKGGTGLGLAIVKHIINRHRGSLAIRSAVGEGSTFEVSLPLARAVGDSVARKLA